MNKDISKEVLKPETLLDAVAVYSRIENCVICNKKLTSSCHSHVVPQFILKNITDNGHVAYGHTFHKLKVEGVKKTTGIKDAYLFRLICKECDRNLFKHYENPDNLAKFNELSENDKKLVLAELALKAHLSHMNMKYRNLVMKDIASNGEVRRNEDKGILVAERIDINEHLEYLKSLRKTMKTNKNPFMVLYNKLFDYKMNLATQTIISFIYDLDGNQIFDPSLIKQDNSCRYFYLMILPLKNSTRVMFYIERKYTMGHNARIIDAFSKLTEEEKLHFLFIALVIYDQQFYMNPSFANMIVRKDKKLVKLYTNTDKYTWWQNKLKDFRKYKNYLSKEFNS